MKLPLGPKKLRQKIILKYAGKRYMPDPYSRCILTLNKFRTYSQTPLEKAVAFEIGAGQYLMAAIGLSLFGFQKIVATDILNAYPEFVSLVIKYYKKHAKELGIKSVPKITKEITSQNLDEVLLNKFNIQHYAPYDAANTDLPDNSVDYVFSNSVFEHINAELILNIIKESYRILRGGGIQYASIDCRDHRTYKIDHNYNPNITHYDFLQYSQEEWDQMEHDSKLHSQSDLHQNRLRITDYEAMFIAAGFEIVEIEKPDITDADRAAYATIKIAEEFKNKYSHEQLMEKEAHFVLRKPLNN